MKRRKHSRAPNRAEQAFLDVLPPTVRLQVRVGPSGPDLVLGDRTIQLEWAGEGDLGDVRRVLDAPERPDLVVGRRLSPGARDARAKAGVSWVDETGAAEVALGTVIVSKTGLTAPAPPAPARWTPAALAVAESLLGGTAATVSSSATS